MRTLSEWNDGHANCAERIPVQDDSGRTAEVLALADGDRTHPVVVYCRSGVRAESAASVLRADGFTAVTNGGGWVSPTGNAAVLEEMCACDTPCPSSSSTYTSCAELLAGEGAEICTSMEDVASVHCQHSCGTRCPPDDSGTDSDTVASREETDELDEATVQNDDADDGGVELQSGTDIRTSDGGSRLPRCAFALATFTLSLQAAVAMEAM